RSQARPRRAPRRLPRSPGRIRSWRNLSCSGVLLDFLAVMARLIADTRLGRVANELSIDFAEFPDAVEALVVHRLHFLEIAIPRKRIGITTTETASEIPIAERLLRPKIS